MKNYPHVCKPHWIKEKIRLTGSSFSANRALAACAGDETVPGWAKTPEIKMSW